MQLVERDELLARLGACLAAARSTGRLVLVGGDAGVGKTTLVRSFVDSAPGGFRVLWGACDPLSTPRPLAPFQDMAPLAKVLAAREGHSLLTALLDELSDRTVMVVEDAHWADEATLDALRFVGRRVTGTRSVVVVTYRDDEVGAGHPLRTVLGDLSTAAGCERLLVPPLSSDGVRALTAGHALNAEQLHRITGGNTFYVTEVLAAPGWTVPLSVSDAVLARVSRVSDEARALIDLISVAPGGVEPEVAARLVDDASAALDESAERGILVLAGSRIAFRHELARLAIEGALAAGRRRELHVRLLDALEARPGTDLARLAHHADAAADGERVLRHAPAAARESSARGSHREAARQLERAVGYADALPARELADLLSAWAEERRSFDESADRVLLLQRIIELRRRCGDVRGVGLTLTLLVRTLWALGRVDEASEQIAEAIDVLLPLGEGPELARAYAVSSLQELTAHRGAEAVDRGTRGLEIARRVGARQAETMALNAIGMAQLMCFEQLDGVDALEGAARLAARDGDTYERCRSLANLGIALVEIRHYARAEPFLEDVVAVGAEHDLDGLVGHALAELASVGFAQGRWDDADRLAIDALRHREISIGIPIVALCVRGRIAARRGDVDASSFLGEAWALARDTGDLSWVWPIAAGRAEAAWLGGRASEIASLVEPTYRQARAAGVRWAIGELGAWLIRAGAMERLPEAAAAPYLLPWSEAAEEWRRLGCPYERAEALADGDETAMRESLAILTRLGAEPLADRLRARMRNAGVASVPARPRASTLTAPAQLTRRQLEVLGLLGDGLTNAEIASRLFISEKTAGHHVSAILQKLGARSRGEAAAAARKRGIAAPPA